MTEPNPGAESRTVAPPDWVQGTWNGVATKFEISSNDIIYSPLSGGSGVSFGWASDSNSQLNYFLQSYTDSVYNAFIYE